MKKHYYTFSEMRDTFSKSVSKSGGCYYKQYEY